MDPLSLSLGIAGIVPLVASVIQLARNYMNAVAGAKSQIAALITELEALQSNIDNVRKLLESDSLGRSDLKFDQTSVLMSCSAACEARLCALAKKLGQESSGRMSRYLWPLNEKEHQKAVKEFRNFTNWMQFALSIDGCRLLSRTSDDVLELLRRQLEEFHTIQSIEEKTTQIYTAVQNQTRILEDSASREHRTKVLDWVSASKHTHKQDILRRSRTENTGKWLLHKDEYIAWRDGLSSDNVLWCKGIQGSGKTHLASLIVDDLLASTASSETPIAFFYFDHQDQESQTPLMVVSCILRQILEYLPELPETVVGLHNPRDTNKKLSELQCESLISECAKSLTNTYLVIDALDECGETKHLKAILRLITELQRIPSCRILATSRPHIHDIVANFQPYPQIKIEAQVEDLHNYLQQELAASSIYDIADQSFTDYIVVKLTKEADGMFLLPVLQLRTILKEPTLGEMEDRLRDLSHGLTAAFEDTISRIRRMPESRSRIALTTLMYLSHCRRPLGIEEVSDVLALQQGRSAMNPKYRPTPRIILECCQGLVLLDPETNSIRIAHYAIHEYLVEVSDSLFPRANIRIALDCMRYMLLDNFSSGPCDLQLNIKDRLKSFPFLAYASQFWGEHARDFETDPEIRAALQQFFGSREAMASGMQIRRFTRGYHERYFSRSQCLSCSPLHNAAQNGLAISVKELLDQGTYSIDERTSIGTTPLITAASGGHTATVKLLLDCGADPRLGNIYGSALQCAAEANESECIRQLVSWGISPDERAGDGRGRVPLSCALDRDSAEAFETLVDLGAELHLETDEDDDENLFDCACRWGAVKTVDLMLSRGWVQIDRAPANTGLHKAAAMFSNEVLKRLIDAGADLSVVNTWGLTPLATALLTKNREAVRLLQAAGAES